ncbi:ABC transporter permease subunit [Lentzea albida]|uniref:ABC-2 family transporter protein n=1 Tax=Lentzea albida TaxID=65499 RepID=A0A1H9WI91_9PSEU|nr:ABC transporter permease subunit [Lentzea albida]SES33610.1 ABC-2 family transporter protein [Lentzea albida]
MIWAAFRLQRLQLLVLLGVLVVGSGAIVLLRSNMIDVLNSSQLARCVALSIEECAAPPGVQKAFRMDWSIAFESARALIIVLPALIGVFVAAPLYAQELEQGTHVLAFTQSVSRTRWMFSKLVVALVPALVVLVVLQYLVWWWLSAAGTLGPRMNGPLYTLNFGIDHVSPVAYALFAFTLGTFLGAVFRRSLVAMTAGLAAFVVVRFALSGVAYRLVPVQRRESGAGENADLRADGVVLDSGWLDAAGRPVPSDKAVALADACKLTPAGTLNTTEGYLACTSDAGLVKRYASVIPESSAPLAHLYDFAIFGGLAVLLLAATAWALRRQS